VVIHQKITAKRRHQTIQKLREQHKTLPTTTRRQQQRADRCQTASLFQIQD